MGSSALGGLPSDILDIEETATLALVRPAPATSAGSAALPRIRRCTFRRLTLVERKPLAVYDAECLYPDRTVPVPLGDIESARPICGSCTALGIFRPDEY